MMNLNAQWLCFFPTSLFTLVNVEFAATILHRSQFSLSELELQLLHYS